MRIYIKFFYVSVFIIILFLPSVSTTLGFNIDESLNENRAKATKPVFNGDSVKYIKKYYKYFKDNFTGRNECIRIYNNFKFSILGESTVPDRVLIGKDNYLFYSKSKDEKTIEDYQGLISVSGQQINEIYHNLKNLNQWLSDNGIDFYLIIAPDKQTIYPEKMPDYISRGNLSSADRIIPYLVNNNINVIDLRGTLTKARLFNDELYYKTDTHWNTLGAYVGYREIVKNLYMKNSIVSPVQINLKNIKFTEYITGGDLFTMLGIKDYKFFRDAILHYKKNYKTIESTDKLIITEGPAVYPRCIIYRDSFGAALQPLLSNNFSYASYISGSKIFEVNRDYVLKTKPDVLLVEIVERHLKFLNIKLI